MASLYFDVRICEHRKGLILLFYLFLPLSCARDRALFARGSPPLPLEAAARRCEHRRLPSPYSPWRDYSSWGSMVSAPWGFAKICTEMRALFHHSRHIARCRSTITASYIPPLQMAFISARYSLLFSSREPFLYSPRHQLLGTYRHFPPSALLSRKGFKSEKFLNCLRTWLFIIFL